MVFSLGITVIALVLGHWLLAGITFFLIIVGLGVVAFLPIGVLAIRSLEMRFVDVPELENIDGIIVLSGGPITISEQSSNKKATSFSDQRLRAGLELAQAHPKAKLLFTGRSPYLPGTSTSLAASNIREAGINTERVILEEQARTTAENASFSMVVVGDQGSGAWVLVTSAFHMRRALASFHAAGWPNLIAHPVHQNLMPGEPKKYWILDRNLKLLNIALKEWVGFIGYRLTGRA